MADDPVAPVREAFQGISRPEHFTNYEHCEECADHDEVLRSDTPDSIGLDELGNPGWDPICYTTTNGYFYYLPALARLAFGKGGDAYVSQFLFHLDTGRIEAMTSEQASAVLHLVQR